MARSSVNMIMPCKRQHNDKNRRKTMSEEEQKKASPPAGCRHAECAIQWLKVVDDISVAGMKNRLPRLYWVTGILLILVILL